VTTNQVATQGATTNQVTTTAPSTSLDADNQLIEKCKASPEPDFSKDPMPTVHIVPASEMRIAMRSCPSG
jgi:hypothetical protein